MLEELISSSKDNGRCNPIRSFSADEILDATDNFRLHFHAGGFYKWYKCTLHDRPVLIKKYEAEYASLAYRDIAISSHMSGHKNVLKLLGCCLEFSGPALVHEHAEIGPLHHRGGTCCDGSYIPWKMRLKIVKDIANAITYLHIEFPRPIIHRNIKLSNIFLDKDHVPKLCSFDLCVSIPEGKMQVEEDRVIGTWGYLDPVYVRNGTLTERSDVYSFGIMLLALLTGGGVPDNTPEYFATRVEIMVKNGVQLNDIVDPRISEEGEGVFDKERERLNSFLELALRCVKLEREDRPWMIDVAKELVKIDRSTC